MVPALQFRDWQWLAFALTAPVVACGGWPFHRAAWTNLRHGAATMDTLVSLGTWPRSAGRWALFLGGAAWDALARLARATAHALPGGRGRGDRVHPAGRYLEARAKRRAGAALRALLELGAKDVAVLRDGREDAGPGRPSSPSATGSWSGRARRSPPTASSSRAARRSTPRCSPASRCRSRSARATAVTGATVNAGGRLVVRATRVGADTQLAQMARLVEQAQTGKAAVQRLADRVSAVFVPGRASARRWPPSAAGWPPAAARPRRSPPPSPC